ncbi:MAG: methyltransferase family protein [Vicinamibacteraceae bacterium]
MALEGEHGLAGWLARWRVPLGFAAGAAVFWLARPTVTTLAAGAALASVGEIVRIWAAGHVEKSREVTQSGPYWFVRHPLYVGSAIMGAGLAVASGSLLAAALIAGYLALTMRAATTTEDAFLRRQFGAAYDRYRHGAVPSVSRRFSLERVWRNREHRAVVGLLAVFALLLVRMWMVGAPVGVTPP